MLRPVTVSIDVPQEREHVYEFLDVLANHKAFTDHLLRDWELSGPECGVGARARVHTRALGVSDVVDIEVVDAKAPSRIVERNTAAKAGRIGEGTYRLHAIASGGTRIEFEYRWIVAPPADRVASPLVRSFIRRTNETAMRRLRDRLATLPAPRDRAMADATRFEARADGGQPAMSINPRQATEGA